MAFNPLAGKNAYVAIGSATMAFDSVTPDMEDGLSDVTNFNSSGYAQFISGVRDVKVDLSGPYDQGNMAITLGSSVTVTVGYTNALQLVIPGLVKSIKPDIKVKDAERISVTVQSSGVVTTVLT